MIGSHELTDAKQSTVGQIVDRAARRRGMSAEESSMAAGELVKFLRVCADSTASLAPSAIVDDLWHEFILHTKAYSTFCANELGTFVHHVPSDRADNSAYMRARDRIAERFGSVDERFWPAAGANCDSSCGSECSN